MFRNMVSCWVSKTIQLTNSFSKKHRIIRVPRLADMDDARNIRPTGESVPVPQPLIGRLILQLLLLYKWKKKPGNK